MALSFTSSKLLTTLSTRQSSLRKRMVPCAEDEVTIRRRPPLGYTGQRAGPLVFELQSQEAPKPKNILEEIVWYKNEEVEAMRSAKPVLALRKMLQSLPPTRNFKETLLQRYQKRGRPAVIAEVKKASPSKGVIQPDFDPVKIAQAYEKGGASCLSVLTDQKYFQGSFENLRLIKGAGVKCPLLCKEFIIDGYQLLMARVSGADAVLLIAAVLPNSDLDYFLRSAAGLGMQCLVEVHSENELERISKLDCLEGHIVGINNRDLETFEVDLNITNNLLNTPTGKKILERRILVVGESGIYSPEDVDSLHEAGCQAVLVGESIVKEKDQAEALSKLLEQTL